MYTLTAVVTIGPGRHPRRWRFTDSEEIQTFSGETEFEAWMKFAEHYGWVEEPMFDGDDELPTNMKELRARIDDMAEEVIPIAVFEGSPKLLMSNLI